MKEILSTIKPNKTEVQSFTKTTAMFLQALNKALPLAKSILGGSGAKGTWLSGNHDVDIFVLFPYTKFKSKSAELSNLLEPALKKSFPKQQLKRLHGSRDYFQLTYQHLHFEVVPILKISQAEQALNITDISPLHAVWVNAKTKTKKDDILRAKQFFQAQKLYGAESYIGGFSGYVIEILIAYYGSFEKLLTASLGWKIKEIIDIEKHYRKKDPLFELNQSKLQSPLIVIDPVDKSRNAAAALTMDKFLLFKQRAKQYLAHPDHSFFAVKQVELISLQQEAKKKNQNLVYITLTPLSGKEDVVGIKIVRVFQFLQEKLKAFEITTSGWDWHTSTAILFYFTKLNELPAYEIRNGPPLKLKQHVHDFKQEHEQTYIEQGKIIAKIKTEHPHLKEFVQHVLKQTYVKERVEKIQKVEVM